MEDEGDYKIIENVPHENGTYNVRLYSETQYKIIRDHGSQAEWCMKPDSIEEQAKKVLMNPSKITSGNRQDTRQFWSDPLSTNVVIKIVEGNSCRISSVYPRNDPPTEKVIK